ncbi:E3 ubiquitin-protein ligase RNF25-like isoform X2 [Branchiostoma floridae]|uniref:E3 ubiquitin-protein ligase RNF25 n=1 Tax=Branchiostoma floridae TaxID=7739 RepID=A0A9J7M0I3_BRAFL|nr:E3 ubiquitin-protein ligase RNF25-like isoform X2 [Branchiostoma floridae]
MTSDLTVRVTGKMAECLAECMENSTLQVELEILESIYLDELLVEHGDSGSPSRVEITIHPATADNVEAQFVRLTLSITLPREYPQELPSLAIQNPRGLSELQVNSLYKSLQHLAQERQGESMLYEIIEFAKDSLTHNNLPSCECAICLYPFNEMDDFTKTECYHYFHCHCLGRYIQHTLDQEPEIKGPVDPGRVETPQNEVVCPMCREPINYDLDGLLSAKPPAINEDEYKPDKAMMRWQADMARVYKKQQSQGGIIDIEAEKNKFFIKLETPRPEGDSTPDVASDGTERTPEDPTGTDAEGEMAGIGVMATVKTAGRYQGRRENPRDGWRDRSKGGDRRQYREGRKSPRDGEKVKIEVKERQKRENEEEKQTVIKEPTGKRDEDRFDEPQETGKKGNSKTDGSESAKPEQSISFVHKGSDQSTRSDRQRGYVRSQPGSQSQLRDGDEADKKKYISTSDRREQQGKEYFRSNDKREQQRKTYQNGLPASRNEQRTIISDSSQGHSERYHNQQHRGDNHPKKTQNRTRQRDFQRQNPGSQSGGRRADDKIKSDKGNATVEKKRTQPHQQGIRNEKDDGKWKKSDHSAAKEDACEARTVTNDKTRDISPLGPPPGFEKTNHKKGFTRPPPGFDDFR